MNTEIFQKITRNLGYVVGPQASVTHQLGDVGVVPAWVRWLVCQREWRGWPSKVSSIGYIGGNTRIVSQIVSWVAHYFSNSFQRNDYCSREMIIVQSQKENSAFRSYTLQTSCFQSFPWIFEFKVKVVSRTDSQKQPPDLFCKKSCSQKFCNIHRKTPVLEHIFYRTRWSDCFQIQNSAIQNPIYIKDSVNIPPGNLAY